MTFTAIARQRCVAARDYATSRRLRANARSEQVNRHSAPIFLTGIPSHAQAAWAPWRSALGVGRACLLLTSIMLVAAGITIMLVGMTRVFVPQDLQYMGLSPADLRAINPRLIPLIAHDRAGFGGGLCCTGLIVFFCVWCGHPSRSLWQALAVAGLMGFATAIGIHPLIGYLSPSHLAPAVTAAALFIVGLILSAGPMGGLRLANSVGRGMQTGRSAEGSTADAGQHVASKTG